MDDRGFRLQEIQRRVLDWYAINRRDLPWRDETDPYRILVSEVMLQQTGVARVGPIYERFIQRFPTFQALAEAPRRDVLQAWAGAGYNRRAVHLHECARIISSDHAGHLPEDPTTLRTLPGLGPYTVAAVLSFVFHQDVPTLDTNVRRVLSRSIIGHTVADRELKDLAARLVPSGRSSDWNQALMDLGATTCIAIKPRCLWCPLREICAAVSEGGAISGAVPKKVAERQDPYPGSRRFYRGKIVAVLRDLPLGTSTTADFLLDAVKPGWSPSDLDWVEDLARGLAEDGLAAVIDTRDGCRISAPLS